MAQIAGFLRALPHSNELRATTWSIQYAIGIGDQRFTGVWIFAYRRLGVPYRRLDDTVQRAVSVYITSSTWHLSGTKFDPVCIDVTVWAYRRFGISVWPFGYQYRGLHTGVRSKVSFWTSNSAFAGVTSTISKITWSWDGQWNINVNTSLGWANLG